MDLQAAVVEQQVVELVVVDKSAVHNSTNSMAKEILKNQWPVDPSVKVQVLVALEALVDLLSMVLDPVVQEVQVVKEVDLVTVQEDLQVEEFLVEQAEALVVIHLRLQKME